MDNYGLQSIGILQLPCKIDQEALKFNWFGSYSDNLFQTADIYPLKDIGSDELKNMSTYKEQRVL